MGGNHSFSQSDDNSKTTISGHGQTIGHTWRKRLFCNFSHPSRDLQMIDRKGLEMREKTNCSGTRLTAKHGRVPAWWEAVKC